ncbi:hypothetical protein [Ostreibacterium oceani]|uniref:Uncharacterized protein n=1 Tax=Ostreibacterium oceani TaxID=2654998 RepID=A0A6N7F2T0_9GAMM|nr:hypothetical protein [Ostreibacterium oceani]MPV86166.1 hypothetical protein [Ostreibacterium oceani]
MLDKFKEKIQAISFGALFTFSLITFLFQGSAIMIMLDPAKNYSIFESTLIFALSVLFHYAYAKTKYYNVEYEVSDGRDWRIPTGVMLGFFSTYCLTLLIIIYILRNWIY